MGRDRKRNRIYFFCIPSALTGISSLIEKRNTLNLIIQGVSFLVRTGFESDNLLIDKSGQIRFSFDYFDS